MAANSLGAWSAAAQRERMDPEAKLAELGLTLPDVPAARGNYLPYVRTGNLLYCAGTLPVVEGGFSHEGQVGADQTVESGYDCARVCALNTLATLKSALGSLSKVKRVVLISGFVNGVSGFAESPAVLTGASDRFVEFLGDAGRHARAAVAVAGLPKNVTVEIQVTVEVED
jgi:enamine deaminase RidA (YjgF/YER057c/UK114 family)